MHRQQQRSLPNLRRCVCSTEYCQRRPRPHFHLLQVTVWQTVFQALGSVDLRDLLAARDAEIAELKALLEEASYQESELVYENRLLRAEVEAMTQDQLMLSPQQADDIETLSALTTELQDKIVTEGSTVTSSGVRKPFPLENSHQVHEGQQAASVGGTTTADPGKTAEVHRLRQRLAHMQKYIWRMLRSIQARFCTPKLPRQTVDPQINGSKEPMLGMPVAMRCVRPLRMIWREAPC